MESDNTLGVIEKKGTLVVHLEMLFWRKTSKRTQNTKTNNLYKILKSLSSHRIPLAQLQFNLKKIKQSTSLLSQLNWEYTSFSKNPNTEHNS